MSLTSVKAAIITKLNDMGSLKSVYGYETTSPSGYYPYAAVTLREGDGKFGSTDHNVRRQGFWIRVYQEQSKTGQGIQTAETIATSVVDELQIAFDMDTTLSGTCKYIKPLSFNASYIDREFDVRILEIQLDAVEVVSAQ